MEIEIPRLKDLTAKDFTSPDAWVSFKFERERLSGEQALLAIKQERLRKWEREVTTRERASAVYCLITSGIALLILLT